MLQNQRNAKKGRVQEFLFLLLDLLLRSPGGKYLKKELSKLVWMDFYPPVSFLQVGRSLAALLIFSSLILPTDSCVFRFSLFACSFQGAGQPALWLPVTLPSIYLPSSLTCSGHHKLPLAVVHSLCSPALENLICL